MDPPVDSPLTARRQRLADRAEDYGRDCPRPQADALGIEGLPRTRAALDGKVADLCARLASCGTNPIPGKQLVSELCLMNTRALRRLVAYARVWQAEHRILGFPGSGYLWADSAPGTVKRMIWRSERMARCYFYIAALAKREGIGIGLVQLVFDFIDQHPTERRQADDLAAHLAAEGFSAPQFLDAFIGTLARSEQGRQTLADAGRRHAQVLLPREVLTRLAAGLDRIKAELLAAGAG